MKIKGKIYGDHMTVLNTNASDDTVATLTKQRLQEIQENPVTPAAGDNSNSTLSFRDRPSGQKLNI